uniref:Retrotransposon gag domain-containing protein n=3 Tax=Lutzomyia longipalpis TaxID=7200 RepID=A0A1B0CY11_LUTLO
MTNNTYDSMYYSAFPHAVKLNSEQGVDKDGQKLLPPQILAPSAFWSEPIPSMQIPPIPQPPQLPPQLQEQLQQPMQPSLQENQLQQLLLLLQQQQKEIKEQKEQQQHQKAASSNVIFHTFIGAREIELLIREFNPSANSDLLATEWIKEIELLGKIYKWDPYLLMMYGTMRLGGVARMWYEYSLESIKNWEDFKRELINNFPRSIDSADILSKLIAKKRQSNETLEEYFHSIVKMGKRIKLPDETIKEYLIRGLEQSKDQIVLSSIGPCSLTEFLQHMQRLEMESRRN